MTNTNAPYQELICETIRDLALKQGKIQIQQVIDALQDFIIDTNRGGDVFDKSKWLEQILYCAEIENITLLFQQPNWKAIEDRLVQRNKYNNAAGYPTNSNTTAHQLTEADKEIIRTMFDNLDPKNCWILDATKKKANEDKTKPKSVEEKVREFALSHNLWHPCHSLIIDVEDAHWKNVFTEEELKEIRGCGDLVLNPIPMELREKLDEISQLESAIEVYKYGLQLPHDPITQPLLSWLSIALVNTAKYFIKDNSGEITTMLENDKFYYLWSFVNTIFHGTGVRALGSSEKQKVLSKIQKQTSHSMYTTYTASNIEFGAMKFDNITEDTKERDNEFLLSLKKMANVLGSQLPKIVHDIHILGYHVNGNSLTLLDVDCPKGYVTRIRRIENLLYPTCNEDFVSRIVPLLELTIHGKMMVYKTLKKFHNFKISLRERVTGQPVVMPPCFFPGTQPVLVSTTSPSRPAKYHIIHHLDNSHHEFNNYQQVNTRHQVHHHNQIASSPPPSSVLSTVTDKECSNKSSKKSMYDMLHGHLYYVIDTIGSMLAYFFIAFVFISVFTFAFN